MVSAHPVCVASGPAENRAPQGARRVVPPRIAHPRVRGERVCAEALSGGGLSRGGGGGPQRLQLQACLGVSLPSLVQSVQAQNPNSGAERQSKTPKTMLVRGPEMAQRAARAMALVGEPTAGPDSQRPQRLCGRPLVPRAGRWSREPAAHAPPRLRTQRAAGGGLSSFCSPAAGRALANPRLAAGMARRTGEKGGLVVAHAHKARRGCASDRGV